jgi:hypothetical protein
VRDLLNAELRDTAQIPGLQHPVRVKYDSDEDGVVPTELQRRCNSAVDATSTKRDGMARKGKRNYGLIVILCLPQDRKCRPFVLQIIETEDSKLDAKVQKTVKVIVRILADNNWLVPTVFTDGDSCTSPVHRIGFALREAVCEMLVQLHVGAYPTEARITRVTLGETQQFFHMMGVFNGHGVYAADFVHFLPGCVARFFDQGHTVERRGLSRRSRRRRFAKRLRER